MDIVPKILLTGASGWFGQSFIYAFIKMYGYKNIDSLDLLTSDGRDIYHKVLDCTFQTSSLESYSSQKKIDLFVQAAFLTRDKIKIYGESEYKKINYKLIQDSQNLADRLNPSTRVLISSGAVENINDMYGQIKSYEEESVINSNSSSRVIFRVYGAMGINTPLLGWSAISDLIFSSNKLNIISIKSKMNVVRGYVSFEKLSKLILKISISEVKNRKIILSADNIIFLFLTSDIEIFNINFDNFSNETYPLTTFILLLIEIIFNLFEEKIRSDIADQPNRGVFIPIAP